MARDDVPDEQTIEERIDLQGRSLRQHTARGTLINSGFQVLMAGLGFLRRFALAAFLTQKEFGIWGILITTMVTLTWIKELGVGDKYVQQNEPDQEAAFQKAFTLELMVSLAFFVLLCVVLPLYGLAYGESAIVLPGIVLAASVPISALEAPVLIAHRRMQFVRQRLLVAADAVPALVVTILLGALGAGYWSLVIGVVAGSVVGGAAATLTSPYKLRWRFEKATLREYTKFSLPLLGYQASNLFVIQGIMLVGSRAVGVAGLGAMALASSISALAERVDAIVSETIYPAICAVADRIELLHEAFVKSNRIALMWGMPFGIGLALFAGDLVHFVIGDRWESAIGLLAAFGAIAALRQVAFNWQVFMRAVNDTRPLFVVALGNLASMFVLTVPLMIAFGLTGYAIGMGSALAIQILQRAYFLRRLFKGFSLIRYFLRAIAPTVPSAGLVLVVRLVAGGDRTPLRAAAELALYLLATIVFTVIFEREFLREILGYMRGGGGGLRTKAQDPPRKGPPEPSRA